MTDLVDKIKKGTIALGTAAAITLNSFLPVFADYEARVKSNGKNARKSAGGEFARKLNTSDKLTVLENAGIVKAKCPTCKDPNKDHFWKKVRAYDGQQSEDLWVASSLLVREGLHIPDGYEKILGIPVVDPKNSEKMVNNLSSLLAAHDIEMNTDSVKSKLNNQLEDVTYGVVARCKDDYKLVTKYGVVNLNPKDAEEETSYETNVGKSKENQTFKLTKGREEITEDSMNDTLFGTKKQRKKAEKQKKKPAKEKVEWDAKKMLGAVFLGPPTILYDILTKGESPYRASLSQHFIPESVFGGVYRIKSGDGEMLLPSFGLYFGPWKGGWSFGAEGLIGKMSVPDIYQSISVDGNLVGTTNYNGTKESTYRGWLLKAKKLWKETGFFAHFGLGKMNRKDEASGIKTRELREDGALIGKETKNYGRSSSENTTMFTAGAGLQGKTLGASIDYLSLDGLAGKYHAGAKLYVRFRGFDFLKSDKK